jgi:radical SAM superfamily enzyme YgiQ (UPF0313 family)
MPLDQPSIGVCLDQTGSKSILLVGINAKYIHASFGLRYLYANLQELQDQASIVEFDINQRIVDIAERILSHAPDIVGIGVYIWNVSQVRHLVQLLKKIRPTIQIVLGGPEVSYETASQKWLNGVDFVLTGEADLTFRQLCRDLISGSQVVTGNRPQIIHSPTPTLSEIQLPYDQYNDDDVSNRIIYVEASRGCPFTCEFCLSSLDVPVRAFELDCFMQSMKALFDRGVRHFKFVDRTFNLNIKTGSTILQSFLELYEPGLFLHFEMIPDRLPEALRGLIQKFPKGSVQFEIGIQTFNDEVSNNISRRQNLDKTRDNIRFLRQETGVHLHVDLIAGLPGEDLESFGHGFNQLIELNPHEIQIGILKRLRGTPIVRHDQAFNMVYDENPPYEILKNEHLGFEDLQRIKRFARYWDLVGNSGNFIGTVPLIWSTTQDPFDAFMAFSDWLYGTTGNRHGIALTKLVAYVFQYLTEQMRLDPQPVAETLWTDYQRTGRSDQPICLRPYLEAAVQQAANQAASKNQTPKRQRMHQD